MTLPAVPPKVGLFVTCLVDLFRPTVGFAASSCSRTPAAPSRCRWRRPAAASRPTIPATAPTRAPSPSRRSRAFEDYRLRRRAVRLLRRHAQDALSRRCSPTIRHWQARAERICRARSTSWSASWSTCCGVTDGRCRASTAPSPITIPARACASSASRRSRAAARHRSTGLKLVEMQDADVCCGFGGTFCVKYPDISNAIVEKKTANDRGDRRRHAARRRSRLPDEHGRQAAARRASTVEVAPRRRSAGRHDRRRRRSAGEAERDGNHLARPSRRTPGAALADAQLQKALGNVRGGFIDKRRKAVDALPEFEALRDSARDIKDHTLAHLDLYLEAYEAKVIAAGGHVHCAATAERGARHHPRHLPRGRRPDRHQGQVDDRRGDRPQRPPRGERHHAGRDRSRRIHHPAPRTSMPSHIIAPAVHLNKEQVEADFRRVAHASAARPRPRPSRQALLDEARGVLRAAIPRRRCRHHRRQFPGRRDRHLDHRHQRGQWRPDADPAASVHIVLASIEKIVPTLEDAAQILRVLARSATGQDMSRLHDASRPARAGPAIPTGRSDYHVVLLDNGRSAMLGTRVPGHAALHPLRRLHEPLPGLSRGRRPRLWLGLSRADGRGADAVADRRRQGRPPAQRLDLLRALRKRLPDAHPAAEDDAALARARVRARPQPGDGALRPRRCGPSSPGGRRSTALATSIAMPSLGLLGARQAAASASCRSPAAGRSTATCRRRRAGPSCSRCAPQGCARRAWRMSARDAILAKVRRSLRRQRRRGGARSAGGGAAERRRRRASSRRAASCREAERIGAVLRRWPRSSPPRSSGSARPRRGAAGGRRLSARPQPAAALRMGDDPRLAAMPWDGERALEIRHGAVGRQRRGRR